ncbi:MAG: hypothetical protein ACLT38_03470 [Akkermansia sp.]
MTAASILWLVCPANHQKTGGAGLQKSKLLFLIEKTVINVFLFFRGRLTAWEDFIQSFHAVILIQILQQFSHPPPSEPVSRQ